MFQTVVPLSLVIVNIISTFGESGNSQGNSQHPHPGDGNSLQELIFVKTAVLRKVKNDFSHRQGIKSGVPG